MDLIFSIDTIPLPVSTNAIGVASPTTASSSATTIETIFGPTPTPIPTPTITTISGSQLVTETAQTPDIYAVSDSIITQNSIKTPKLENETMPNSIEEGIITKTDPSLSKIAEKSSQAVTMRETAAWVLLSSVTLLFIGLLLVDIAVLCIYKYRQKQDNTAEAPAYEMAGDPCYESIKIANTHETNIYEPIEHENA